MGRVYHTGSEAFGRVRDWRKNNPQYWRRRAKSGDTTKGHAPDLHAVLAEFFSRDSCVALQDSWPPQVVAVVGIIAWLRGHALQDFIAGDLREIMVGGNAVLDALATSTANWSNPRPRESH